MAGSVFGWIRMIKSTRNVKKQQKKSDWNLTYFRGVIEEKFECFMAIYMLQGCMTNANATDQEEQNAVLYVQLPHDCRLVECWP